MTSYNKPYKTVPEQISLLEQRGLQIPDRIKAEHYLAKIGYYRLSGYSYVFRESESLNGQIVVKDTFRPDVHFEDIKNLYVFDKRLRLLVLDALERIEIALRVDVSYELGKHDKWAHLQPQYLHNTFSTSHNGRKSEFDKWKESFTGKYQKSREDFVQHFKQKYTGDLPVWMAVELWDFGMLSLYIGNMKDSYKAPIASTYGIPKYTLLRNWLHSMNVVRNICAHHSRLWNRVLPVKLSYPSGNIPLLQPLTAYQIEPARLFPVLCIIQYLMRHISPNSHWHNRLRELFEQFPHNPHIALSDMGVVENWHGWDLWKA